MRPRTDGLLTDPISGEMIAEGSKPSAAFEVTRVGFVIGSISKREQREKTEQQPHPGSSATGVPLGSGNGIGEYRADGYWKQRIEDQGKVRETGQSHAAIHRPPSSQA